MIYIWCDRPSDGANELVAAINTLGYWAKRKRRSVIRFDRGDTLVNWGSKYPHRVPEHVLVLNSEQNSDKLAELTRLKAGNVPCVEFSASRQADYLPRRRNHQGGSDLLSAPIVGDYYVRKYEFAREFRVHVFKLGDRYESIRSGVKVPRPNFTATPHPWIRSYDAGWMLDYGSECQRQIRQVVREAAKSATSVLGLDFAAIDVGVQANGSPIVLEANRAPGNEKNTSVAYAKQFIAIANKYQETFE